MANGGSLDGVEVLGSKGWQALHANPTKGSLGKGIWEVIYITQVPYSRNTNKNTNISWGRTTQPNMMCTKGGVAEFQPGDGHMRDGYYGWVDFYFSMV